MKGWVANLATDPLSDDTKAMEFVAAGKCDVTIANTYYYGRLMEKNPALPLAYFLAQPGGQRSSRKYLRGGCYPVCTQCTGRDPVAGIPVIGESAKPVCRCEYGIPGQSQSET